MSEEKKVYSFEEVAKHNGKQDCWLLISGKVYDVTRFLDDHPGGDEILLTAIGKDATDDFEDVGHSDSAREMMKDFLVGSVDVSTLPVKQKRKAPPPPQATSQASQSSSGFVVKLLQFILPLMILGIAFVFKKMKKEE